MNRHSFSTHITEPQESYQVGLITYLIVGWSCALLFGTCLVLAFLARQYAGAVFFAFFAGMGVYIILGTGRFTIASESIKHRSALGTYGIRWDEIRRIEFGFGDGTFVLHGDGKRFVISPMSF
jgi:hypothetical protein